MDNNQEELGWIVVSYFQHEPTHVYGIFTTQEEARKYAERNRMADHGGAYNVQQLLNAHYEEPQLSPADMGWVGKDGRP